MLNRPKCLWQSLTEVQVLPVAAGPEMNDSDDCAESL